uniref:Uncharacterized protein n=1 Tax=Meloidogyne floridensis TaxID=298350 RepID=A0A915PEI7_9BILA
MNFVRKTSSHLFIFVIQLIYVIGDKRTNLQDKMKEMGNFDNEIGKFKQVLSNLKLAPGAANEENLKTLKTVLYSYEACLEIIEKNEKSYAKSKDDCDGIGEEDEGIITQVDKILKNLKIKYAEGKNKNKKENEETLKAVCYSYEACLHLINSNDKTDYDSDVCGDVIGGMEEILKKLKLKYKVEEEKEEKKEKTSLWSGVKATLFKKSTSKKGYHQL